MSDTIVFLIVTFLPYIASQSMHALKDPLILQRENIV